MHACVDLLLSDSVLQVSHVLVVLDLTGRGRFHRQFQLFPRVFFRGFLELHVFQINKIDVAQLSRIIELRFFDCPLLFLSSLSCFSLY